MAEQRNTLRIIGIVLGCVIICGIWCWKWPYWCPICPNCSSCAACDACEACEACEGVAECCGSCPDGAAAAEIVIEDVHTALWMLMDNEFVENPGHTDHAVCGAEDMGGSTPTDSDKFGDCLSVNGYSSGEFRPGVLIQTGNVLEGTGPYDHLDSVTIISETEGVKTLTEDQFDWLDINAVGQACPLDPLHAYALFYDDQDDIDPDPADLQVTTECDGATAVDASNNPLPPSCLRDRGLHADLKANKDVITYWPHPESLFTVDITPGSSLDGHILTESTLHLCQPVTVDHWNEGCWKDRYEDVVEVRVSYIEKDSNHGGYHTPIMNGGSFTGN